MTPCLSVEVLEEKLAAGRRVRVGAAGVSMGPAFGAADWLELDPALPPRWGDVVLWRQGDRWIAHRVLWKTPSACLLRGDGNATCDGWVPKSRLRARVVAYSRAGKRCRPGRWRPGILGLLRTVRERVLTGFR